MSESPKKTRSLWIDRLKSRTIFWYLLAGSFLIRFPFFFRDYIDRDESTFILMGQAWVDGYLPYTVLWDVKPPLTFLFYAVSIFLFGKSLFVIRLLGTLLVAFTSFFSYKICLGISTKRAAVFCGFACVFLQSMFGSIQGVMSEHILMCFFMAALYALSRNTNAAKLLAAGVLLGISLMVKINIAFSVLLVGCYLLWLFYKRHGIAGMSKNILLLSGPALVVVLLTVLPYYLSGQETLWWDSVILAPLAYTEGGRNTLPVLIGFTAAILFVLFWSLRTKHLDIKRPEIGILIATLLGILFSFIKGGRINSHYLIMLYPVLLILLCAATAPFFETLQKKAFRIVVFISLLLPMESYLEYIQVGRNYLTYKTPYNGEGYRVPEYILDKNINTENILFLGYHIGYWMLEVYPPVKTATHPSNICKSEMFPYYNPERNTAMEEIRYIMEEIRPATLVTRTGRLVFDKKLVEENAYINKRIESDYILETEVEKASIYIRKVQ
jgi:hypothetical protein